jgi:hypothetical protein
MMMMTFLDMSWYSSITLGDLQGDQSKETDVCIEHLYYRVQGSYEAQIERLGWKDQEANGMPQKTVEFHVEVRLDQV